jgi:hypothetical protein
MKIAIYNLFSWSMSFVFYKFFFFIKKYGGSNTAKKNWKAAVVELSMHRWL